MIKVRNGFSIKLSYLDMLLEKWKSRKKLTVQEKEDLKYILKMSEICTKCREIDNLIIENKVEYCQTYEMQYWCKCLIFISIIMSILSFLFYFSLTLIFISLTIVLTMLFFYIKKSSLIIKCLNCGSTNSFVKIKKYLNK